MLIVIVIAKHTYILHIYSPPRSFSRTDSLIQQTNVFSPSLSLSIGGLGTFLKKSISSDSCSRPVCKYLCLLYLYLYIIVLFCIHIFVCQVIWKVCKEGSQTSTGRWGTSSRSHHHICLFLHNYFPIHPSSRQCIITMCNDAGKTRRVYYLSLVAFD